MKKEEAISYLQQLYPNGGHCWLDEQRIEAISMAIDALKEEPVSEGLEQAAHQRYEANDTFMDGFKKGAKWQKENLWKPADGDDLPEIDREVIAILDYDFGHYKVVYAHRPNPNGWDGTNIDTGKKEHFEPKIYDKGGWNAPNIVYWLDYDINELLCIEK